MNTLEVVDAYLASRRALGVRLERCGRLLRQFVRETGKPALTDIGPDLIDQFLRGQTLSATWLSKYHALAGLYRFAVARGHVTLSPMPLQIPKLPPQQTPYIYSIAELQRLVKATEVLYSRRSTLQVSTYRTLLLLLYGTGMRVSEALGLQISDVDLHEQIITVRNTKFYKSRLVPVGSRLNVELAAHLERRRVLAMPEGEASAFLSSRKGHHLIYQCVSTLFQRLGRAAGIACPAGELRPPRLHDLRHTAAVHRMEAWYREGKDVQILLPRLATYLGHVSIASTQRYLQMTPQLLQLASQRFAAYAAQEVDRD